MRCPTVTLGDVLAERKEFMFIEPDEIYARCRVQTGARGIVLRDRVPGSYIKTKKQQICRAGEFLVAEIDAKVGGYGIVPPELDGAIVSSHYFLFEIDKTRLHGRFLDSFCRTPQFLQQVNARGSTNYAAIRPKQILGYRIRLPTLTEQHRIATKLDRISVSTDRALTLCEEIDQHIHSLVQSVHFHLAEPTERKLGDFLELCEDRVAIDNSKQYRQIGVRSFCRGLFFKPSVFGNNTRYTFFNRLSRGLLLVSQPKGWEGAVAVCETVHKDWYVSPEYRTFRCRCAFLDDQYLAALLPTRWFQLALSKLTRGQGARRERLRPEMLLDMPIRMPSIEQQRAVLLAFGALRSIQHMRNSRVIDLRSLQRTALDQVFKGCPI